MKSSGIKEKAISFRNKGYSYSMISDKLGLSKSTLSDWLKEIPYTPNNRVLKRIQIAPAKSGKIAHDKKIARTIEIKSLAEKELGKLSERDLWFLGIGLYLGEGSKLQESVKIVNADPETIKLAIKWLKNIVNVNNKNFSISIHTYPDNNIEKTLNYWSKTTGIPRKQFGKTQIDTRTKLKKKKGKLPYGTAHLVVRGKGQEKFGVNLHRRIMGWIESATKQINAGVV